MGYTHYWYREKEYTKEDMQKIIGDFHKIMPLLESAGVKLAGGCGENDPEINTTGVCFNGSLHCEHPKNSEISISWPTKAANGIGKYGENRVAGHWFAGAKIDTRCCDGDCSYETFDFPRIRQNQDWQKPENGKWFDCCKTAYRPYDLAVNLFLVIAKHYLGNRIEVSSDGSNEQWADAIGLAIIHLGYGFDFQLRA